MANAAILEYVELHRAKERAKSGAKEINDRYKAMSDEVRQFLMQQPQNAYVLDGLCRVELRARTKPGGMNLQSIGEGYVEFHRANGRQVSDEEREGFLATLKARRKAAGEVVHDVRVTLMDHTKAS